MGESYAKQAQTRFLEVQDAYENLKKAVRGLQMSALSLNGHKTW